MKHRYLFGLISSMTLISLILVMSSNSSGPGGNRTGSPGSSGTCTSCHGSNNSLSSSLTAELIDKSNNTPVTDILPSTTYTLRITAKGNSSKMGFQAIFLDASNASSGSFGSAPAKTSVSSSKVWGHTSPGTINGQNVWEIDWTSPSTISGNLTVYAASVISNGNGNDNGDDVKTAVLQVKGNTNTVTHLNHKNVEILGNPMIKSNLLKINQTVKWAVIWNLNGKLLEKHVNCQTIDISHLNSGSYILQGVDESGQKYSVQFIVAD